MIFPLRDPAWWEPSLEQAPPPLEPPREVTQATLSAIEIAWLEIELVDEEGQPAAGEPYRIQQSDGMILEGRLDEAGFARIDSVAPGTCKVIFPLRDSAWWEPSPEPALPPIEAPGEVTQATLPATATDWLAIELVGEDDKPVSGERYRLTLSDGSIREGTLDDNGQARFEDIEPGTYTIAFPDLDQNAWEQI